MNARRRAGRALGVAAAAGLCAAIGLAGCASGDRAGARAAASVGAPRAEPVTAPFTVKVIAFNDYHGNLQSPGSFGASLAVPAAQRPVVGGADVLAAHVARLKAQNPRHVVVGAGDLVGASPLVSALFFDEPAVETLNRIGLEFSAVGNHEFDHGAAELLRLQRGGCRQTDGAVDPNSCRGAAVGTPVPFEGAGFQWLAANVLVDATGRTLLPAYGVKRFDAVDVAFIGLTLRGTPRIVTPTGVAGLTFGDEAATINALLPTLKARGIEAVVVLLHEGGTQSGGLADIDRCDGALAGSPLAAIVGRLDDAVDLVVSGHTHSAYRCALPNARGRPVTVTSASAYGRVLSDIDLTIDPATRDVTAVRATNRLVDRSDPAVAAAGPVAARTAAGAAAATATAEVAAGMASATSGAAPAPAPAPEAEAVRAIVAGYDALVAPLAARVVGTIAADLSAGAVDAACNMPAGELIADAQLAATAPAGAGRAVIALMNRGGVRHAGLAFTQSQGEGDGNVTYGEAFALQPFGNNLVTTTLTARDIKHVLEQQFAGCRGQPATVTRPMLPSRGFRYTWNGAAPCDARITDVTLDTAAGIETLVDARGVLPQPDRGYRVTVNNYMAGGGDGFDTFLNGRDAVGGVQDIDALVAYLARNGPATAPYARDAAQRIRRIGGSVCPTGGALDR